MSSLKIFATAGAVALAATIAPNTASASYMSKCKELINAWNVCSETQEDCTAEESAIEEQCKCHVRKGDEWKIVVAAVGDDGVCDADWGPNPKDKPKKKHGHDSGDEERGH